MKARYLYKKYYTKYEKIIQKIRDYARLNNPDCLSILAILYRKSWDPSRIPLHALESPNVMLNWSYRH